MALCKEALGVPVTYYHADDLDPSLRAIVGDRIPCVIAETDTGERVVLLTPEGIERCRGSVGDLGGRLLY